MALRKSLICCALVQVIAVAALAKSLVVLIPGSGSSGPYLHIPLVPFKIEYFKGLQDHLSAAHFESMVCPVQEDGDSRTMEERADDCEQKLKEKMGDYCQEGKVGFNLVGHSMGGLIARILAHRLSVAPCIRSVTTVSTPHRGTLLANVVDHQSDLLGQIVSLTQFNPSHMHYLPEMEVGSPGLTIEDNPQIAYFSISDSQKPILTLPPFEWSRAVLAQEMVNQGLDQTEYGTSNDGVVPEYSMIYGTYLGHVEAHHAEAACIGPYAQSKGCLAVLDKLIPLLQTLIK